MISLQMFHVKHSPVHRARLLVQTLGGRRQQLPDTYVVGAFNRASRTMPHVVSARAGASGCDTPAVPLQEPALQVWRFYGHGNRGFT